MSAWNGYEVAAVVFAAFAGFSGLAFSLALAFDPQGIMRALRGEAPLGPPPEPAKRAVECTWCKGSGKSHFSDKTYKACPFCDARGFHLVPIDPPARETAGVVE